MPINKIYTVLLTIWMLVFLNYFTSCKKDSLLTKGGDISFSTDTLKFDTVFTTFGSVTRSVKLFNNNNKRIKFSQIRIQGGDSSVFRMNIDGQPTKNISDVELAPNDSLYIFVALTVNPTTGTLPFLIEDKILVTLNGDIREVALQAYGQDAHYIRDSVLGSQTWINDKPYVIIDNALVDSGEVLTIQKGCRIYVHANSKLYVAGTLRVFGTKQDSVIFQGDRLDRDYFGYKDYPGEWRGIHFLGTSRLSTLNYCIIKNAGLSDAAVFVQPPLITPPANEPMLDMRQCIVANSAGYGLFCVNTFVRASNCLVHSCGLQNIAIIEGGNYDFNYCTFSTFGGLGINHAQQPTAAILNYRDTSLTGYVGGDLNAKFTSCIIYGPLDDEVFFNQKGNWAYNVTLDHCLFKRISTTSNVNVVDCIINMDPLFNDFNKWDYHPVSGSPVREKGKYIPEFLLDLDGVSRLNPPAIGCYEVL